MPHIIGGAVQVVKTEDLSIEEYAGNVATSGKCLAFSCPMMHMYSPTHAAHF
jgi:hypothetical protein